MTTRNRVLGLLGRWKLGDGFAAVVAMLPESRRTAVRNGRGGAEQLAAYRGRERRRVERLWGRLDPRLRDARLRAQR
jgi:hypothetical protein